eukprot:766044-Hanusia_phi.AAC.1
MTVTPCRWRTREGRRKLRAEEQEQEGRGAGIGRILADGGGRRREGREGERAGWQARNCRAPVPVEDGWALNGWVHSHTAVAIQCVHGQNANPGGEIRTTTGQRGAR